MVPYQWLWAMSMMRKWQKISSGRRGKGVERCMQFGWHNEPNRGIQRSEQYVRRRWRRFNVGGANAECMGKQHAQLRNRWGGWTHWNVPLLMTGWACLSEAYMADVSGNPFLAPKLGQTRGSRHFSGRSGRRGLLWRHNVKINKLIGFKFWSI